MKAQDIANALARMLSSKEEGAAEQVLTKPGKNQKKQLDQLEAEEAAEQEAMKKAKK